jgi:molybdopterin-guanine dinucleotide biosynthesis protein A
MRIAGVILAGGENRRMGGREKAFLTIGGVPILTHVANMLAAQCHPVMISAGGDPARFAAFGLGVIADTECRGPLVGLTGALDWFADSHPDITHILSVPSDTPFLPNDLGTELAAALKPDSFAAFAVSDGRLHPVIGLWPLIARHGLHDVIARGALSFHAAREGQKFARVEWIANPRDPFFNVNTPEDLMTAVSLAGASAA